MSEALEQEETLGMKPEKPSKPKRRLGRLILLGVAGILLIDTLSGFAGYQVGLIQRKQQETGARVFKAASQFERGLVDMRNGNYEQAKQRFAYVAEIDPHYPGIVDQLAKVELALMVTATPTTGPTQAVAIPANVKGAQALFNQAKEYLAQQQWAAAVQALDRLREDDIKFDPVEVDGLYYIALRNLGVDNMLKNGKLEQGMYDLAIASNYGPLDKEADGFRTWVAMYKTAASYWELDWEKMVYWMKQVYNMLPGIRDGSNYTPGERLRVGLIALGDGKMKELDYCAAADYYADGLSIRSDDSLQSKYNDAHNKCIASISTPTLMPTTGNPITPGETPIAPIETPLTP